MLRQIHTINEWKAIRATLSDKSLGFVPTMGALHEGHLSLVKKSKEENDLCLVSIFVNPTQFNDKNDLNSYPQPIDEDIKKLNLLGTDYLLTPTYDDIYNDTYRFKITENMISKNLCGASRPGHFDGVLTVVMKLLNIASADRAYFGEKDYQQYLLIKDLCSAFFLNTQIVPCPTVREEDGLAMSSRNLLLENKHRKKAGNFYKYLNSDLSLKKIEESLINKGFEIDYIEELYGRRFAAVKLGSVRLIDNVKI